MAGARLLPDFAPAAIWASLCLNGGVLAVLDQSGRLSPQVVMHPVPAVHVQLVPSPELEAALDSRSPEQVDPVMRPHAPAPAVVRPVPRSRPVLDRAAVGHGDRPDGHPLGADPSPHGETAPLALLPSPTRPWPRLSPGPEYPAIARLRGWSGRVMVAVVVDADGRPGTVSIHQSSGHAVLDQAAMTSVRAWLFEPATRDGHKVVDEVLVPIIFSLSGDGRNG